MDIVVNVKLARSLSQSELIMRNLFTVMQIGNTCQSGRTVTMQDVKFRSGTAENPLVITIKNSKTETVMYVRSIPISVVMGRGSPFEQWVAVYPPGDPQNLHFDPSSMPNEGCPQVLVSITIREDIVVPSVRASTSLEFAPPQREASSGSVLSPIRGLPVGGADAGFELDVSRRSDGLAVTDATMPAVSHDAVGGGRGSSFVIESGAGARTSGLALVGVDATVREKERQAQRIKEHVAELTSSAKRAEDMSRTLQENLRIRDDLRRQFQGLEMQLAEQRAAANILERDRDDLRAEEKRLLEQVRQRDIAFQEVKSAREDIERKLACALGERERHKVDMEISTKNFDADTQKIVSDLDESKRQTTQLKVSLRSREQTVVEMEQRIRDVEESRVLQEDAEREKLRQMLDETRRDIASAVTNVEEQRRRRQGAELATQEAGVRLAGIESEVASLADLLQHGGHHEELSKTQALEAQSDLDAKKRDLEAYSLKVKQLELQLQENREELERRSLRIVELHTEAREKDLSAKHSTDVHADLLRKLDSQRGANTSVQADRGAGVCQLSRAEQSLTEAKNWWEELDFLVRTGEGRHSEELAEQERSIREKQECLAEARRDAERLRRACTELDVTVGGRQALLKERKDALEVVEARVAELARQLAAAAAEIAGSDGLLHRLEQDASTHAASLHDARQQTKEMQEAIASMQTKDVACSVDRKKPIVVLEGVASALEGELEDLSNTQQAAGELQLQLEDSLEHSYSALECHALELDNLQAARKGSVGKVEDLAREQEATASDVLAGGEILVTLEEVARAGEVELESTQGQITSRLREIAELEMTCEGEVEQAKSRAAALKVEQGESLHEGEQLLAELNVAKAEHEEIVRATTLTKRDRERFGLELQQVASERTISVGEGEEQMRRMKSQLEGSISRKLSMVAQSTELEERIRETEARSHGVKAELATISAQSSCCGDELSRTLARVITRKQELATIPASMSESQAAYVHLEASQIDLEGDVLRLQTKFLHAEASAEEVSFLQQSHVELLAELGGEREHYQRELAARSQELEDARSVLERCKVEAILKKNEDLRRQVEQIAKLEAERACLKVQSEHADTEECALSDSIGEHERKYLHVLDESRLESHECEVLTSKIHKETEATSCLQADEQGLDKSATELAWREEVLQSEMAQSSKRIRDAELEVEVGDGETANRLELESKSLEGQREIQKTQESQCEEFREELMRLSAEEMKAQRAGKEHIVRLADLELSLERLRSELDLDRAARDTCRSSMATCLQKVKQYQSDREQRLRPVGDVLEARKLVQEIERSLQQTGDQVVDAQETVRRFRNEEDELRVELQKVKEAVRAMSDKMSYQVEHANLQFETIQKFEEQKRVFEGEGEMLTLGLHDAEQRNQYLEKEKWLMQQQVGGRYSGSLQEWATEVHHVKIAAEVARYKEELGVWKQKAESLRRERQLELSRLQRQHEETVQRLRERVVALQAEVAASEQKVRRRAAAISKYRQRGEAQAPPSGVAGLVVPQRPLPPGHGRRKALLVAINYANSHAPLKGCVNDVWNVQCLLRYTFQYAPEQLRLLIDTQDGSHMRHEGAPTKANIMAGLQWLVSGALPGDTLMFVFCGYGTQHPRAPGNDQHEAYLVPCDFAADLPANFFSVQRSLSVAARGTGGASASSSSPAAAASGAPQGFGMADASGGGAEEQYRLLSLLEVQDLISQLPKASRLTVLMDCCFSAIPNLHPHNCFPPTFPKVERGHVDYNVVRDSVSRPRYLELPALQARHTPRHLRGADFPVCWLHCFSACKTNELCVEFPIEGTVQGVFTWAFIKALVGCHFYCGVFQLQRMLASILSDLKVQLRGVAVEQNPILQLSQSASVNDVVLVLAT